MKTKWSSGLTLLKGCKSALLNEQEIVEIKALDRIKDAVFQNEIATNEDYYSLIIRIYTATFRKDVPLTPYYVNSKKRNENLEFDHIKQLENNISEIAATINRFAVLGVPISTKRKDP